MFTRYQSITVNGRHLEVGVKKKLPVKKMKVKRVDLFLVRRVNLHSNMISARTGDGFEGFFKGKSPWIEITRRCGSFSVTQYFTVYFVKIVQRMIRLFCEPCDQDQMRFALPFKLIVWGKHRRLWPLNTVNPILISYAWAFLHGKLWSWNIAFFSRSI